MYHYIHIHYWYSIRVPRGHLDSKSMTFTLFAWSEQCMRWHCLGCQLKKNMKHYMFFMNNDTVSLHHLLEWKNVKDRVTCHRSLKILI